MEQKKTKHPSRDAVGACPLYKKCSGCQMQNMPYPNQLKWKQAQVVKLLGKFGTVSPIIGMENPWHYRNKAQAAFGLTARKQIISGVYQSTSRKIVAVDQCLIEDAVSDEIIVTIRSLLKSFKIPVYDIYKETGIVRHVLIRRGFQSDQIMVVLVTSGPLLPAKKQFVQALLKRHPQITTIVQNIAPQRTNLLLGEREIVLHGKGTIEDILCDCIFQISPKSFYQVNPVQTQLLYQTAIEFADLTGKETVLDAYCGIGTIGLIASKYAKQVIGMEVNSDAVRDAVINTRRNGITNAFFHCADAGDFMTDLAEDGPDIDVAFMDPPRAGSDRQFLTELCNLSPKKIVYISCNPQTLARDLTYLRQKGYRIKRIQPVDMFPHTHHCEVICLLSRQ